MFSLKLIARAAREAAALKQPSESAPSGGGSRHDQRRMAALSALFAAVAASAGAAQAQAVANADHAIRFEMPVLPRIDGCTAGLHFIQSTDEPGSMPVWCGTPPRCLTVPPGGSIGGSQHCSIRQYARREPRFDPNGLPGRNGVREEDLVCESGPRAGLPPVGGVCASPPPPPPAPAPPPAYAGPPAYSPPPPYYGGGGGAPAPAPEPAPYIVRFECTGWLKVAIWSDGRSEPWEWNPPECGGCPPGYINVDSVCTATVTHTKCEGFALVDYYSNGNYQIVANPAESCADPHCQAMGLVWDNWFSCRNP